LKNWFSNSGSRPGGYGGNRFTPYPTNSNNNTYNNNNTTNNNIGNNNYGNSSNNNGYNYMNFVEFTKNGENEQENKQENHESQQIETVNEEHVNKQSSKNLSVENEEQCEPDMNDSLYGETFVKAKKLRKTAAEKQWWVEKRIKVRECWFGKERESGSF